MPTPNKPKPSPKQIEAMREAARALLDRLGEVSSALPWPPDIREREAATAIARAVLRERERCAKLCDERFAYFSNLADRGRRERIPWWVREYQGRAYEARGLADAIRRGDDHAE